VSAPAAPAVGLALCGGRSERMGRDKALLPWRDTDLLGHAVARLASVTPDVALLSGPSIRYADRGFPVVTDAALDGGPGAGLDAGLAHAGGRPVLLLAVDLPLVPAALLGWLVDALGEADAVVPVSPRGREPLCAAYGPACLPALRACVASGARSMTAFWPEVRVREVRTAELVRFGDPETMFLNVNEPEDLQRAVALSTPTWSP
jgi:molybdopterin-guanine dinucleotide biosynthesis protein A